MPHRYGGRAMLQWKGDEVERELKRRLGAGLRRLAADLERRAVDNCPVDTGAMKASIATTVDDDALVAVVAARTPYAIDVEFGTMRRPPDPFMRRALLATAARAPGLVAKGGSS